MQHSYLETLIGVVVIAFVIICIYFGYQSYNQNTKTKQLKTIYATFQDASGISKGSGIFISGIQVGVVEKLTLIPKSYDVYTEMHINSDVDIPADSQAVIVSQGLLGNKVIAITPGMEQNYILDQGEIKFTQSALNVEALINRLLTLFLGRSISSYPK